VSPHIDQSLILEIVGGEPAEARRILAMLFDMVREQMVILQQGAADGDREMISSTAHQLSGATATCGLVTIGEGFHLLETHAPLAPIEDLRERIAVIAGQLREAETQSEALFPSGEAVGSP
jgi:HPt (histidine-containing phosphotransfer) domain-containing protein